LKRWQTIQKRLQGRREKTRWASKEKTNKKTRAPKETGGKKKASKEVEKNRLPHQKN